MAEYVHLSTRNAPTASRCAQPARFEGGYTEPLMVSDDRREATCPACRRPLRHWLIEQAQILAVLALALALGAVALPGVVLQRIRGGERREAPRGAVVAVDGDDAALR